MTTFTSKLFCQRNGSKKANADYLAAPTAPLYADNHLHWLYSNQYIKVEIYKEICSES
eukprot:m.189222 g.189222  ORF g.189222 m.189222 type:complete len:58 (+) comp39405_c0_seq32:405-578(+)